VGRIRHGGIRGIFVCLYIRGHPPLEEANRYDLFWTISRTPSVTTPDPSLTTIMIFIGFILGFLCLGFHCWGAAGYQVTSGAQTGIDAGTGQVPSRRNINDLFNEGGPTWWV
jgi:hypothetical protein